MSQLAFPADLESDVRLEAQDRVAPGRCRPGAPTDPYVLALEHTVTRIMALLRVCKRNEQCGRVPADNAEASGGIESS